MEQKKTIRILVGIIIILIVELSVMSFLYFRKPPQYQIAAIGIAPLGTEVLSEVMSLRVESVREDPVGAAPFTPREGYTFIIPTIVITNLSDKQRDLVPTLTLYIKDKNGNIYNMALAPLRGEGFGGPILPHDKVRQEMAFEVKKDVGDLVFYFETGGKLMAESLVKK